MIALAGCNQYPSGLTGCAVLVLTHQDRNALYSPNYKYFKHVLQARIDKYVHNPLGLYERFIWQTLSALMKKLLPLQERPRVDKQGLPS